MPYKNKYIRVDLDDSKHRGNDLVYSAYIETYNEDYKKDFDLKVKQFLQSDNSKRILLLKKLMAAQDDKIMATIVQQTQNLAELRFIEAAEAVKEKNRNIADYIERLKNEGKLNAWYKNDDGWKTEEIIENGTYRMIIHFRESAWRDRTDYYVSYWFETNPILNDHPKIIQSIYDKKFGSKDEAFKYIDGRKKAYAKYFQDEKPPIIDDCKYYIILNGIQLEGYRTESEAENERKGIE